jgi:hypothetical protein
MLASRRFSIRVFDGLARTHSQAAITRRFAPARVHDGVEGGRQERSIGAVPTE